MKDHKQAELKLVKVGEPVAHGSAGNPEPSMEQYSKACVESRRRVCIKCGGEIPSTKYRNAKYCGKRCRNADGAYRHAVKSGKIKVPGVGSGGAQWGENNHTWKSGIGTYRRIAKEKPQQCNRCSSRERLLVHHIDHNRKNNEQSNLEVLCKRCHQNHHCKRDKYGRYTKGCSNPIGNDGSN